MSGQDKHFEELKKILADNSQKRMEQFGFTANMKPTADVLLVHQMESAKFAFMMEDLDFAELEKKMMELPAHCKNVQTGFLDYPGLITSNLSSSVDALEKGFKVLENSVELARKSTAVLVDSLAGLIPENISSHRHYDEIDTSLPYGKQQAQKWAPSYSTKVKRRL